MPITLTRKKILFLLQIIKIGTLRLVFSNSCLTFHTYVKKIQQFTLKTELMITIIKHCL